MVRKAMLRDALKGSLRIIYATHFEHSGAELWKAVKKLELEGHQEQTTGWKMGRRGLAQSDETMTAEQAKERWTSYAKEIDEALTELANR